MTMIYVNGNPLAVPTQVNYTFEQLVRHINSLADAHYVVTQLLIDGVEVDVEDYAARQVNRYAQVDFYIKSKASLAFDCLQSCHRYINAILELNGQVITHYQNHQLGHGNSKFVEMVELSELFIDLFTRVNQTLRNAFGDRLRKSAESTELEITLLTTLKQIYAAKEKGDLIILCDLLEYELTDTLIQWKQKVIPELERLKDN